MSENATVKRKSTKNLSILKHLQRIVELSKDKGFTPYFRKNAKEHVEFVAAKLAITPVQAALFAHFMAQNDDSRIRARDIADAIKCDNFEIVEYMDDFDVLAKKKLIVANRSRDDTSYFVPFDVINALRSDTPIVSSDKTSNLSITEFFDALEELVDARNDNSLPYAMFLTETKSLINNNQHLIFAQTINSYCLSDEWFTVLLYICELFVNNDDEDVSMRNIESAFESRPQARSIKRALENGESVLFDKKLIENTTSDAFGNREEWRLTDIAKKDMLSELDVNLKRARLKKGLILFDKLPQKNMFFNDSIANKIEQLCSLLQPDNFKNVQMRLGEGNMRNGFACLFYGPPGTGKTESVNMIARRTGRDIMLVDISETKSCWFGESEKKIKQIFDRYKTYVEASSVAPILLFNEADAVIGRRKDVASSNVAQTENAIQNIILQEMENLKGIMIATTNLTSNLDPAIERRFLYKMEFEKPTLQARSSIWQSLIPDLSQPDAAALAERYNFSGGQIENIARKRTVEKVITGTDIPLDTLFKYCNDEALNKNESKRIGFGV